MSTTRWFQDFRESVQGCSPEGRSVTETAFAMRLVKLIPEGWKGNVPTAENRKAAGYKLRSLREARRYFDKVTKRTRDWGEEPQLELTRDEV